MQRSASKYFPVDPLKNGGAEAHAKNDVINDQLPKSPFSASRLGQFVVALRPWSFSASLTPVLLGSCLAYKLNGDFSLAIFIITCLTALSVHAAGNLVNTYFDYKKGVDSSISDDRTLVDHIFSPSDISNLSALLYLAGCVGFMLLVALSPAKMEHLALVYFGGLSSSFLYTGGLGLKYIALGDILIFMTFGPLTVLFAFLTQAGSFSWISLAYAMPLAVNTEAVLHANNFRDMASDKQAGVVSLAILVGELGSYLLLLVLLFLPYLMFSLLALHWNTLFLLPITTIFMAFRFEQDGRNRHLKKLPNRVAQLNLQMGLLFVLACLFTPSADLPGYDFR